MIGDRNVRGGAVDSVVAVGMDRIVSSLQEIHNSCC